MIAAIFSYFPLLSNLFDFGVDTTPGFLTTLGYTMLGLLPLALLAGLASDEERRNTSGPIALPAKGFSG